MKALKILVATVALAIAATTAAVASGDGPCQDKCKNGEACKEKCGNGENCKKHGELSKAQSKQKDAKAATATKAVKNPKATEVAKATK
jgi:hypothetical protein